MVGLALDNRIVTAFLEREVASRKGSTIIRYPYKNLVTLQEVLFQSMYYSSVFLVLSVDDEDKVRVEEVKPLLKTCLEYGVNLILSTRNPSTFKKLATLLTSVCDKHVPLTTKSIHSKIIKSIVYDMYLAATSKKMPITLQEKLLRRIRYTVNVDNLLDEVMSYKTLTELKEFLVKRKRVYNSNFAANLMLGTNKKELSEYIQENISSMSYLTTVLENFVSDLLMLYPQYMEGSFNQTTVNLYKSGEVNGKFNKYDTNPKLYLSVFEKKSYEYLYLLNKRLSVVENRTDRILLIGEMLL